MGVRAVRLAGVWFISSETHAMPDSFCEGDEREAVVEEPVQLECEGDLTEGGHLDYAAGASGASDDPLVVARDWVDGNLAQPSQVRLAHIAASDGAVDDDVAVLREGRTIALLELMLAEDARVLVTSFVACPTDLAGSGS